MSKGVKVIDKGEPLDNAPWGKLKPVNFCTTCKQVATLQAKIYVYEKIIANSNFAPMVQDKPKEEDKKEEHKARWILQTLPFSEKDHEVICTNCGHVAMTFENFSLEEAKQAAKREEDARYLTKYCVDCGERMEVDI